MVEFLSLRLITFGTILYFIQGVLSYNKFCPVICANQACTTNLTGSCTACTSPWTWNTTTSTCELYPSSGWGLVDSSADMGGTITPNNTNEALCACTGGGCTTGQWNYTYYGNMTGPGINTFSDMNGCQLPHYQFRIIFWMILVDNWQGSDMISVTL